MNLIKCILKQSSGQCDLLSDSIKTIGLLAKTIFDKNIGIDAVFIKGVICNISQII